jgi:hypothetical protein
MKNVFDNFYIKDHELLFYIYLISMLVIIILTVIFVIKELKKNEHK